MSDLTKEINEAVKEAKFNPAIRFEYMSQFAHDCDIRREAREEGIERGDELRLIKMICRKLQKSKSLETIADELDEELDTVKVICDAAVEFAPEYDAEKIYAKMHPDYEDENEFVA